MLHWIYSMLYKLHFITLNEKEYSEDRKWKELETKTQVTGWKSCSSICRFCHSAPEDFGFGTAGSQAIGVDKDKM